MEIDKAVSDGLSQIASGFDLREATCIVVGVRF
jgi:hypothetical protein